MKRIITLFGILMISAMLLNEALANGNEFAISIVGQKQSNSPQSGKDGIPVVICPASGTNHKAPLGVASANSFFVIIQNIGTAPVKITMGTSDWYDCLKFKITDRSGKTYTVFFPTFIAWKDNALEMWTFQAGGIRVMSVDFTSGVMVGQGTGWEGLPPSQAGSETATMTATFRYYDPKGKLVSISSKPTEVALSFK